MLYRKAKGDYVNTKNTKIHCVEKNGDTLNVIRFGTYIYFSTLNA